MFARKMPVLGLDYLAASLRKNPEPPVKSCAPSGWRGSLPTLEALQSRTFRYVCTRVFSCILVWQVRALDINEEGRCTSIGRSIASLGTCTARQHSGTCFQQRTTSKLHHLTEIASEICLTTMGKATCAVGISLPLICRILLMRTVGEQA